MQRPVTHASSRQASLRFTHVLEGLGVKKKAIILVNYLGHHNTSSRHMFHEEGSLHDCDQGSQPSLLKAER